MADHTISNQVSTSTSAIVPVTGSFTTTFMTQGQPGVSFEVVNNCHGCDGAHNVPVGGEQRYCNDQGGQITGQLCATSNPAGVCPHDIGTVVNGGYYGPNNAPISGKTSNQTGLVSLQCIYSSIKNPFYSTTISAFTGAGASDLTSASGMQKKFCDLQKYNNVVYGPCATFYTNVTKDFDYQQVIRINEENPNGAWATLGPYIDVVRRVAQTSSSSTAQTLAQGLITTYCIVNNANGWPTNKIIRQIINQWVLNSAGNISAPLQQQAMDIVNHFCQNNSSSPQCNCYNAYKLGANIFTSCQGNKTGACTDINNIAAVFANAPAVFAPQVASLKAAITPNCAVGACVSTIQNATSIYLAPDTFANLNCPANIQLCLQSVSISGSLMPGATISQSCQSSPFNLPPAVPNCT